MIRAARTRAALVAFALVALAAATTAACTETVQRSAAGPPPSNSTGATIPTTAPDGPAIEGYGGQEASFGTVPDEAVEATGTPIRLGMINQEDTPLGSFPELRLTVEAGVEWITTEPAG